MPHLFSFASHASEDGLQDTDNPFNPKDPRWLSLLKNTPSIWRRHHDQREVADLHTALPEPTVLANNFETRRSIEPNINVPRRAVPSLPRPQTFRRQSSEKREKLLEVPQGPSERRVVSVDRRHGLSASAARRPLSPKAVPLPSVSTPERLLEISQSLTGEERAVERAGERRRRHFARGIEMRRHDQYEFNKNSSTISKLNSETASTDAQATQDRAAGRTRTLEPSVECMIDAGSFPGSGTPLAEPLIFDGEDGQELAEYFGDEQGIDQTSLQDEYDRRWILNLSMHFRDKSNREKFFNTYAKTPTTWRRVTISLDYGDTPKDSLEADLSTLHYQRDKRLQIFQTIRKLLARQNQMREFADSRSMGTSEPTIECIVGGQQTGSFPDSGAPANFLSKTYADKLGVPIRSESSRWFKTGIGNAFQSLGTVIVPFSFEGEREQYPLEFHVMSRALRDVVLGGPFLRLTKTLSHFKHRITRKLRHLRLPQVCYVQGLQQQIFGYVDGEFTEALPDTGSDILAMSTEYAKRRSLHIDDSEEHRIEVLFADGSVGTTRGIVKDVAWEFASSPSEVYRKGFYVLDDLECDVLLNYDFLEETDAFSYYEDSFTQSMFIDGEDVASFFTITKMPAFMEDFRDRFRSDSTVTAEEPIDSLQALKSTRLELLQEEEDHKHRLRILPEPERSQADAEFYRNWRLKWADLQSKFGARSIHPPQSRRFGAVAQEPVPSLSPDPGICRVAAPEPQFNGASTSRSPRSSKGGGRFGLKRIWSRNSTRSSSDGGSSSTC